MTSMLVAAVVAYVGINVVAKLVYFLFCSYYSTRIHYFGVHFSFSYFIWNLNLFIYLLPSLVDVLSIRIQNLFFTR